jgi:hypothetical protein
MSDLLVLNRPRFLEPTSREARCSSASGCLRFLRGDGECGYAPGSDDKYGCYIDIADAELDEDTKAEAEAKKV